MKIDSDRISCMNGLNRFSNQELFEELRKLSDETNAAVDKFILQSETQKNYELKLILTFLEVEIYSLFLAFHDYNTSNLFLECYEIVIEKYFYELINSEDQLLAFNFNNCSQKLLLLAEQTIHSIARLLFVLSEYVFRNNLV